MTDKRTVLETSGAEAPRISDRTAGIALAVIVALLIAFVLLFMWTSDTTGTIVRILAWAAVVGVLVLGVVAWFMTPRPVKPKR